jgi:hypothetical protein
MSDYRGEGLYETAQCQTQQMRHLSGSKPSRPAQGSPDLV